MSTMALADLTARCKKQLDSFRIKELKDVLTRLGLPKQGKKQVLMEKIMGVIGAAERPPPSHKGLKLPHHKNVVSRDDAVNVIDDIYRKLRGLAAPDLSSGEKNNNATARSGSVAHSDEHEEIIGKDEAKTRCPCGNSVGRETMIQCDDSKCRVRQHRDCVVIPEKSSEATKAEVPPHFYCELCRIARGDPFSVALSHPLLPVKLNISLSTAEGSNPLQNVEKTFTLTRANRELLHKQNHDIQVWCVLLNDKVPFRMHWPSYAELRVNGYNVRVTNRPGQQLLGANGRDEGPTITACIRDGQNTFSFLAYDARAFCVGVRIIRRCSLLQVMAMIPAVTDGEKFDDAMARVHRCINGGGGQGVGVDDDNDSDVEVMAESITVNLRCPMSGSRIRVAGRFKPCLHMGCFDLNTFVELNQRARKWQCPICLKNYCIEVLIIDPFFSCITTAMKNMAEDVTEVEMKADGMWRPKLEGDTKFHEPWRMPCGALVPVAKGVNHFKPPTPQAPLLHVKVEEGLSSPEQDSLRLGIKRTHDDLWTVNGTKRPNGWAGPSQRQKTTTLASRSSSATDSNDDQGNHDEDEQSVNQEPSEKDVDLSEYNNGVGSPINPVATLVGAWQSSAGEPPNGSHVIVLSDTDGEDGDEPIIGSSGASVYRDSDNMGQSRLRSPNLISLDDLHCDSPHLALGTKEADVVVGLHMESLPFNSLTATRASMDMADKGIHGSELGLQMENNSFWSSQLQNVHNAQYGCFVSEPDMHHSHHPGPVRPTPMLAVAGAGYGLPSPHMEDLTRGSGWTRYSQLSPTTPAYASTEGNGGSNDSERGTSPSESALHLFLPPQPARVQIQSSLPEPLVLPRDEVDNAWFSLSLGGGKSGVDSAPPPCVPSSPSRELHWPTPQARGGVLDSLATASVLLGISSTGNTPGCQQRPGHSRSPGCNSIPAKPRSSALHVRRHHHYYRVDESDSD